MTELTETDRTILLEVATHPGTYASAVSRRTGIPNRTVGGIIIRLEKEAFLTRAAPSKNKGARILTLTNMGMAGAILQLATTMTGTIHAAD